MGIDKVTYQLKLNNIVVEEETAANARVNIFFAVGDCFKACDFVSIEVTKQAGDDYFMFSVFGSVCIESECDIAEACLLYTSPSPRDS